MDSKKFGSLLAVGILLVTSCSCTMFVFDDSEESDANPVMVAGTVYNISVNLYKVYRIYNTVEKVEKTYSKSALLAGVLLGMPVGATIERIYLENQLEDLKDQIEKLQQEAHLNEASSVSSVMGTASSFTQNSLANYSNIWKMTEEHWIRQAEMAAFSQWYDGAEYDPEAVMALSMIYFNNAMMGANATAQFNTFLAELNGHVELWNETEGYESMSAYYNVGGNRISSGTDFDGRFMTVADARQNEGYVYLQTELFDMGGYVQGVSDEISVKPGKLYLFGSDSVTLTDREGNSFTISQKETDLNDIEGLGSGIYRVSQGAVIASDAISEATGVSGAIHLTSGLVMSVDGSQSLAEYRNGSVIVLEDGKTDRLVDSIGIGAQSSDIPGGRNNPDSVDLTQILISYAELLNEMRKTASSAESSSRALWHIYDEAGQSNAWTTTLSVLENYEDIALSDSMKSAMAVSAMQQIADYYESHGGELAGMKLGLLGEGSTNVPFVRGTIYDDHGNVVANDMIFTPLLQTSDAQLKKQEGYTVDSYATAMVWAQGQSILSWGATGDFEDFTAIPLKKGYSFTVNELAVMDDDSSALRSVNSVDLDVKQLEYVPGVGFSWVGPEPIDPVDTTTNYLKIVCMVAGLLLIFYGIVTRRLEIIFIGAGVLVFAWVFSDMAWNKLTNLGGLL